MFRNRLFLAAAVLGGAFWFGLEGTAQAGPPARVGTYRPPVIVNRPAPIIVNRPAPVVVNRVTPNRMPGWDWWRTYPYSSYNAWRNPYWYYPYTPYVVPSYYYPDTAESIYYNNYNPVPVYPLPPLPPLN